MKHFLNRHPFERFVRQASYMSEEQIRNQLSSGRTFFSSDWSEQTMVDAAEFAYQEAIRNGVVGSTYTTTYQGETITVSVDAHGGFETAYGDYMYTYEQF